MSGIAAMHDSIIDDREAKLMSIGCRTIASQRDDTGQGTRLCLDIAVDTAALHTLLQGSIHTCYRQGMNQMLLDVIVAESITSSSALR